MTCFRRHSHRRAAASQNWASPSLSPSSLSSDAAPVAPCHFLLPPPPPLPSFFKRRRRRPKGPAQTGADRRAEEGIAREAAGGRVMYHGVGGGGAEAASEELRNGAKLAAIQVGQRRWRRTGMGISRSRPPPACMNTCTTACTHPLYYRLRYIFSTILQWVAR